MYFPFSIPKSGRKRSAHSRRRFIQSFREFRFPGKVNPKTETSFERKEICHDLQCRSTEYVLRG